MFNATKWFGNLSLLILFGLVIVPIFRPIIGFLGVENGDSVSWSYILSSPYFSLLLEVIIRAFLGAILCSVMGAFVSLYMYFNFSRRLVNYCLLALTCVFLFQPILRTYVWRDIVGFSGVGGDTAEVISFLVMTLGALPASIFVSLAILNTFPKNILDAAFDIGATQKDIVRGILRTHALKAFFSSFLITTPFLLFSFAETRVFSDQEKSIFIVIDGLRRVSEFYLADITQLIVTVISLLLAITFSLVFRQTAKESSDA